jgi:hypothetical protein
MLPFLQVMRQEVARCGLWPRIRIILEIIVVAGIVLGIGTRVIIARTAEWQYIAGGCFVAAAFLGSLSIWFTKHTYLAWQTATLAYERSDEPPTRFYGKFNHAA